MTGVARLIEPPGESAAELKRRVAELENQVVWFGMLFDLLLPTVIQLAERVDATTPIIMPPHWRSIKEAAIAAHYSKPAMYRFHHGGVIDSQELGGKIAVDVSTLAARIAEHLAKRKKRK